LNFNVPNFEGNILVGATAVQALTPQLGSLDAYATATWRDAHTHTVPARTVTTAAASPGEDVPDQTGPVNVSAFTHTHSVSIPSIVTDNITIDLSAIKRSRIRYIIKY
jgi:hypothetical protein